MKKLLFTAAFAGSIALNTNAQITFQKTFGGTSSETGYSVQQTNDGGFITTGFTGAGGSNDILLIKTDANGDTLWTKTYGGSSNDIGRSVQQTADLGYIITGEMTDPFTGTVNVFLIKTNTNGDTLWTKTYGGTNDDYGQSVQQTTDLGYIITGYTLSFGVGFDVYLIKTDVNGNVLWTKTFGGTNNDYGQSVQQTTDGGYIVLGSTNSFGSGGNDYYLIKTNSLGDTLWTKAYGVTGSFADGYSVRQTADGGYILCGTIQIALNGAYLIKTDGSGTVQWSKTYFGPSSIFGFDVFQTTDGSYILTGEATGFGVGGFSDAFLMRTDALGDTLWSRVFGGTNFDYGFSVKQTTDGGFVVAGNTTSFTTSNGLYLIKTDSNGISGTCNQFPANPSVNNATTITSSTATVVGSGVIVSNTATIVSSGIVVNSLLLSTSITSTDVSCNGGADGKAVVTISGGTPGYTYIWSNGQSSVSSNASDSITDQAGTYTVEITDAAGCTGYDTATINEPPVLNITAAVTDILCNGDSTGAIDLTVSGGTPPYSYSWTTGDTTQDVSGLSAGSYIDTVFITDANGCFDVETFAISEPAAPLSTAITVMADATSCGSADGSSTVTASGGTSPYTYSWSSGGTDATDTALTAGDYTVTVTDTNGCTTTDSVTIDIVVPPQPICLITVDSTSTKNVIVWEKPITTNIDSFRILREFTTNNYQHIGSVAYSDLSVYIDNDPGINPNTTAYRYKMSVIDTCGNESDTSDFHKTIHLQVFPGVPPAMELSWDDYEGFLVTSYRILRDSTGLYDWEIIGIVPFGVTSYTNQNPPQTPSLSYIVEVVPPDTCTATQKAGDYNSSRSNTQTSVTGINEFKISDLQFKVYPNPNRGVFALSMNYEFNTNIKIVVYNVLGQIIYESEIRTLAKGGSASGGKFEIDISAYPAGIYHLQITTDRGTMHGKVVIE